MRIPHRKSPEGAVLANSLVQTKFYLPRPRRSLIDRPRLSGRLNRDSDARLTLISAPAGFGKTTLLTAWLAAMATETRAVATDEASRGKFRRYWRFAGPGILLIRKLLLPAVRREAERRAIAAASSF